jgi:AcrR family transcriptional regulator
MPATLIQKQRSKELIEATWTVVARVGVDNATVREIAREAGCTTGALWHHFRNRDDLIDQAIDQLAEDFFDEAEREWQAVLPGVARLRVLVRHLAPREAHQRDGALALFRLWSGASDHEPTALALRAQHRRLFDLVLGFIEEAQQRDEIADDVVPSMLAEILIALGDGMCVSRVLMLSDGSTELDAAVDTVLERFATRVKRR